jgi:hypothetical protein
VAALQSPAYRQMFRDITGLKEAILAHQEKNRAYLTGLRSSLDLFREHHNSVDDGTVSRLTYDKLDAKSKRLPVPAA